MVKFHQKETSRNNNKKEGILEFFNSQKRAKNKNKNFRIFLFDCQSLAKNSVGWLKFLDFTYVYSHIWLILPTDDRHFFFRHRPLETIATLAKNKNSLKKQNTCPQWNPRDVCLVPLHPSASGDGGAKREVETTPRPLSLLFVGFFFSALLACCRNQAEERFSLSLSLSPLRSCLSVHYLSFKVLRGWPWQHHCLLLPVMYVFCVSVPPNPKSSHCVIFELCMSSGCFLAMACWFLLASAEAVALKSMWLDPRNFTQSPGCIGVHCHGQCLQLLLLLLLRRSSISLVKLLPLLQWLHFLLCGLLTCLPGRACRVLDPGRRNRMPMATMRAVPLCWSSQVLTPPSLWSIHLSWLPIRRFLCIWDNKPHCCDGVW